MLFLALLVLGRFALVFTLVLFAYWFWGRGVPGEGNAIQLDSAFELVIPNLIIGQGFRLEHFLDTSESIGRIYTRAQSGGCWEPRLDDTRKTGENVRKNMRGMRSMLNRVKEVKMFAGSRVCLML